MIRNYIRVAIRYLFKHKGYTAINIFGLSIGIACCILIMLFVKSEWSFDRFHEQSNRIYRARMVEQYEGNTFSNVVTPLPLGPALQNNLPEVENMSRVFTINTIVKNGEKNFSETVHMVDTGFFSMFNFPIIQGDAGNTLYNSSSIILSESMAEKHFGQLSPLGKNLQLQLGDEQRLFTVQGVAKNPPLESSIRFDFLIPFSNDQYLFSEKQRNSGWQNVYVETYVLLGKSASIQSVSAKLPAMVQRATGNRFKPGEYQIFLQGITDIHLNNQFEAGIEPISDPKYSLILGTIGMLVLLIACINFITLSIGRSVTRALEVGVRKVLGAGRPQLMYQYWGEAMIITFVATILGVLLAFLAINSFNEVVNRSLVFAADTFTIGFCITVMLVVALISGIYPAFVLSGYAPIQVLKGKMMTATGIGMFRKGLIVGQFVASIVMIIGTMVIGKQLGFLQNKNLGYEKEQVVIISTNKRGEEGNQLAHRLKEQLKKNQYVSASAVSMYSFAEPGWANLGYSDDKNVFRQFRMNVIDYDFLTTMGLELSAGRNFSPANAADISGSMIINEAMAKEYGWTDPIGKKLPGKYDQQVIGVIKDFNYESLHNVIQPLALVLQRDSMFARSTDIMLSASTSPRVSIRLKKGELKTQVASLENDWKVIAGDQDFQFRFLDETLNAAYEQEQRLGSLVNYASYIAIIISCMGLFGLATLIVVRRTREIGIRKVLGAGVGNIVVLLSKDFVVLILVASVIAFPIAWIALQKWLQDFTYRIEISWLIFLAASILSLMVALITVGIQAIRAAKTNPVKSLRSE